jgi:hypothetical protein
MTSKGWLWILPLLAATLALGGCGGSSSGAYHGHPLYTDAGAPKFSLKGDRKPGDVNGQGFADWYVVSPSGSAVRTIP